MIQNGGAIAPSGTESAKADVVITGEATVSHKGKAAESRNIELHILSCGVCLGRISQSSTNDVRLALRSCGPKLKRIFAQRAQVERAHELHAAHREINEGDAAIISLPAPKDTKQRS